MSDLLRIGLVTDENATICVLASTDGKVKLQVLPPGQDTPDDRSTVKMTAVDALTLSNMLLKAADVANAVAAKEASDAPDAASEA